MLFWGDQVGGVGQISVMQDQVAVLFVGILVEMVNPVGIKKRGSSFDSVYFIAFFQKKLCEISSVLACYTCD